MKLLIVLSAVVACAFGKPSLIAPLTAYHSGIIAAPGLTAYSAFPGYSYATAPAYYRAEPALAAAPLAASVIAPAPAGIAVAAPAVKSQYHAQDELGNAAYGHSEPGQVHTTVQDAQGSRVGSFSYLNPTDGQIHRTDYVADALGYRVAANDLPVAPVSGPAPVAETPEVVAAREALLSYTPVPVKDTPEVVAAKEALLSYSPVPVQDTPEVVAAREAHLAAKRERRSVEAVQTPAATAPLAAPVAVAAPVAKALVASPLTYPAPLAYSAGPLAYSAGHLAYSAGPLAYSASPLAYSAAPFAYSAVPAGLPATLTTIVNNPGHAVSYRID